MTPRTGYTSRPNANCAPATEAAPAGDRQHSRRGNAGAITSPGLSPGISGGYRYKRKVPLTWEDRACRRSCRSCAAERIPVCRLAQPAVPNGLIGVYTGESSEGPGITMFLKTTGSAHSGGLRLTCSLGFDVVFGRELGNRRRWDDLRLGRLQDRSTTRRAPRRRGSAEGRPVQVIAGQQVLALIEFLAECIVLRGQVIDPGARLRDLAVAFGVSEGDWFGGA